MICTERVPGNLRDRNGIEALTKRWDKTVIGRTEDLRNWVGLFRQFISRNLKVYAYANNHYAGHGPGCCSPKLQPAVKSIT